VGTLGGGLFRFHAGHFQAFTKTDGLGSDTVICVLIARDGSLWIATTGGLTRLRDGVLRNYTTADGLSNNVIDNVFQDSSGMVWVATHSGIDRSMATNSWQPFALRIIEESRLLEKAHWAISTLWWTVWGLAV